MCGYCTAVLDRSTDNSMQLYVIALYVTCKRCFVLVLVHHTRCLAFLVVKIIKKIEISKSQSGEQIKSTGWDPSDMILNL